MTTLNQQERTRLLRTLQDDVQFRDEVRSLLLPRELLELPERFAQFASFVAASIERQEEFNRRQEEFNRRQEEFVRRQEEVNSRQEEFNSRQEGFNQRQEGFNRRTEDTLGILKGNAARRLLNDSFEAILDTFRLDFVGFLNRNDLARMARLSGLSNEVSLGQRQSFYRADMVLECIDEHGNTHYIVAEASFTADLRDSDRAIRNAGFLTRMTGHVAHPMVASVFNDRAVQELVEAGTIHWLQFDPKQLEAD